MHRRTLSSRLRAGAALLAAAPLAASLVVAGGATTSSADAAELRTWKRLANCESDRRWHINTGNGYYGGLQFSDPTWDAYKWKGMKHRADLASRKAQILSAENVLDAQGWGAWPACSDRLGLGPSQARGRPFDGKG